MAKNLKITQTHQLIVTNICFDFRLIKVEEELRKEQTEMHKLLKAKQDLIDIQKKRIEHLTNRNSGNNNPSTGGSINNIQNSNSNKSINNIHHQKIFLNMNNNPGTLDPNQQSQFKNTDEQNLSMPK